VFDVNDGLAGFPTEYIGTVRNGVAMKILDGTLRIRSSGAAKGYVGGGPLFDAAGFVDSGDIIERHGERFYFAGRKGGVINIGGLKVHPEEIEAVINRHPCVRMSLVRGRQNRSPARSWSPMWCSRARGRRPTNLRSRSP
jgi:acyl-CoA synthetase (AMP-forming)/AMP-acid ligase II